MDMTMPTRQRDIRERDFYCPELRALLKRLPRDRTPQERKRIVELRAQAIRRYWPGFGTADESSEAPTTHDRARPLGETP